MEEKRRRNRKEKEEKRKRKGKVKEWENRREKKGPNFEQVGRFRQGIARGIANFGSCMYATWCISAWGGYHGLSLHSV